MRTAWFDSVTGPAAAAGADGPNGQCADHADDECSDDRKQGRTVADAFFVGRSQNYLPKREWWAPLSR